MGIDGAAMEMKGYSSSFFRIVFLERALGLHGNGSSRFCHRRVRSPTVREGIDWSASVSLASKEFRCDARQARRLRSGRPQSPSLTVGLLKQTVISLAPP